MLADEFGESLVGFRFLHAEHFVHVAVGFGKLQFPIHQPFIDLFPIVERQGVVDLHAYLAKVLLVGRLCHFGDDFLLMDVFFQCQEDLGGVDGFDEVVGDFRADGLVHDVFLFAFGDHDHGRGGAGFLDAREGFQPAQAGHVLVEQDKVVGRGGAPVQRVLPVRGGFHLVAFLFEEQDVCFQQFYLVVNPK